MKKQGQHVSEHDVTMDSDALDDLLDGLDESSDGQGHHHHHQKKDKGSKVEMEAVKKQKNKNDSNSNNGKNNSNNNTNNNNNNNDATSKPQNKNNASGQSNSVSEEDEDTKTTTQSLMPGQDQLEIMVVNSTSKRDVDAGGSSITALADGKYTEGEGADGSSGGGGGGGGNDDKPGSPSSMSSDMPFDRERTSSFRNLLNEKCCIPIPDNLQMLFLVMVSRALPLIAGFGCVGFIIYLLATPSNWETNSDATDADVLARESNRGLLVSVVIAILLNLIGALMFYLRVKESLVVTNYGFILGPVIGYMLDQSIGTDKGFRKFMTAGGIQYTFSSLIGGNFMRYIVTVFLDLFISNPIQDVLKQQVKKIGVIEYLKSPEEGILKKPKHEYVVMYDNFVVLNYPSILQSIVAFVTFNAYTNQTRFAWAYASSTLDRDLRVPPGTIMICTAIAGVLYLNFYTIMDYISEREYFDVNTKLIYTLFILLLLYGLNATNSMEAPVDGEEDENYTAILGSGGKTFVGLLVFTFFVCYGFVYPLYTRLGCFGKYKPKQDDDTFGDTDEVETIGDVRNKVSDDVLDKIQQILKDADPPIDITLSRANYERIQTQRRKRRKK